MPDIPDFTFKSTFPLASIVEAAQRKAQIEQQSKEQANQSILQGLQAIGGIGQSLVAQKQKIASALATGRALGIPDDQSRAIGDPEQIVKTYTAKQNSFDLPSVVQTATALGLPVPASLIQNLVPGQQIAQAQPSPNPAPIAPGSGGQSMPGSFNVAPSSGTLSAPQVAPTPPRISVKNLGMATKLFPRNVNVETGAKALADGSMVPGTKIVNPPQPGGQEDKEQDRLEGQAINRVATLRGDASLARTENQRDASIQAYNTIKQIKAENRLPSQIEYYDILGQMWKARTGSSPTDQAIRDLDTSTLHGDLAKAYQYFSGKPSGRTTEAVLDNIQDFAKQSGVQADKLHAGYWRTHLVKPQGLSQDRWANIANQAHGLTFGEATAGEPLLQNSAPTSAIPDVGQTFNGAKVTKVTRIK